MADLVGQQLGNYKLLRLLGYGGFAEVYLGEHIHLATQAAIKVMQVHLASDDSQRFLIEARTIAHLLHPHIVRVFDFGVNDNIPFLVMDYAPNGSLRQRHPKGTILPPDTILSYVKQVAEALQYAHDEKLIHRDVKPENMLLGRHNEILLSDFGVATVAHSTQSQSVQSVMGTAPYIAPEQLQGRPRPASDQYALGIVVYEWLCGARPFQGSFTELYSQHMFVPPPPLRQKNPDVSPAVEEAVMTALAKESQQRFVNIRAFANALDRATRTTPTLVSPPDFVPPTVIAPTLPVQPPKPPQVNRPSWLPVAGIPADQLSAPGFPGNVPNQTMPGRIHGNMPHQPPSPPDTSPYINAPQNAEPPVAGTTYSQPISHPQPVSRRALLIGAGVTVVALAGGGIAFLELSQKPQTTTSNSTSNTHSPTSLPSHVQSLGLLTPGVLQWGADYVSGAPYVFQDPSNPRHLIGFEVEIAAAIAALMHINQTQIEFCYATLEQALASNQIDMVMNGWEKTPDREKTELFSDPYYRYGQQIVVRVDDTRFAGVTPTDVSALGGYTVGTGSGYLAETIMNNYNATNPPKKINIHSYTGNLVFSDLVQHKLDAFFLDFPIATYYVLGTGPGVSPIPQLKLLGNPINLDNYYVGFNKSSSRASQLLPEINQAFAILKANGTLYKIYAKWQLWNDDQASIGVMKG